MSLRERETAVRLILARRESDFDPLFVQMTALQRGR